jgi:hypothetical protein
MFSDRFIEFKAYFPAVDADEAMIGTVYLNPMSIEAFVPEMIQYDTEAGEHKKEPCVRVHTRHDVFNVIMDVEQFRNRINHHYAQ